MFTNRGYYPPTQNEIHETLIRKKKEIDPDFRVDDASSPDGLLTNIEAERDANLYEHAQQAYDSKDPNKATGYDLDVICKITGKQRDMGTPSKVDLKLKGVAGTVVIQGSLFDSGADTTQWRLDNDITIPLSKEITATATCTINGAEDVAIGSINRIIRTVRGLQSVTNTTVAFLGRDAQTDESLRIERQRSVALAGSNSVDAMYADLYEVPDLLDAAIYTNNTDTTNPDGLPKRSLAVIAHGGDDMDVAKAIFRNRSVGCAYHAMGTQVTVANVYDHYPQNFEDVIFSRPIYVNMIIALTVKDDGTLPSSIDVLIFQAILDYAQGDLPLAEGFNQKGYKIGDSVAVAQIQTPINYVLGQYGLSYLEAIDINGQSFGDVVAIAKNQMARFNLQNMSLTLT